MESSDFPGSWPRCPAHADTQWTAQSPRRALIDGRVVTLIPSAICEGRGPATFCAKTRCTCTKDNENSFCTRFCQVPSDQLSRQDENRNTTDQFRALAYERII